MRSPSRPRAAWTWALFAGVNAALLGSSISCQTGTAARSRESTTYRRAAPAAVDLSAVRLSPGIHEAVVTVEGRERTLGLVVPAGFDREHHRVPLVVHLHGLNGHAGMDLVRDWVLPAFESLDPLVLVPQCPTGEWWLPENAAFVLGLVEAAKTQWPVQSNRVVVMGYSNGGIGAWFFARMNPESFTAAIPIAADYGIIGETPLPVYVIHGSRDEVFDVAPVRQRVNALRARGFDVTLNVKHDGTHRQPNYRAELKEAARWLEELAWRE